MITPTYSADSHPGTFDHDFLLDPEHASMMTMTCEEAGRDTRRADEQGARSTTWAIEQGEAHTVVFLYGGPQLSPVDLADINEPSAFEATESATTFDIPPLDLCMPCTEAD